jgi:hypothetical protein
MKWTWHAQQRMAGRMARLASAAEIESRLAQCEGDLSKSGQTGVRVKALRHTLTVDGSTGSEVWAVVDEAERIVTVMLRDKGQAMNRQWMKEVR